jgi:hypothetical protein
MRLAVDDSGNIYAGVGGLTLSISTDNAVKWNGTNWSSLGLLPDGLGMNNDVRAVAVDSSGIAYAGGYFTPQEPLSRTI